MLSVDASHVGSFDNGSSTLFLFAGVLLTGYATLNGVAAVSDAAYQAVENVLGPAGFALGFLGLLVCYPEFADQRPLSARVGAVCVALGAIGFSVLAAANLGRLVGAVPEEPPAWAVVFLGLAAVGMIPGFVASGIAAIRTESLPRTVGLLLLAPPAIFGVMLTGSMLGSLPQWSAFAISGGQALAYLSIGYVLRTGRFPAGDEVPVGDARVTR